MANKKYKRTANPEFAKAMRDLGKSSAASQHDSRPKRQRTRSAVREAEISSYTPTGGVDVFEEMLDSLPSREDLIPLRSWADVAAQLKRVRLDSKHTVEEASRSVGLLPKQYRLLENNEDGVFLEKKNLDLIALYLGPNVGILPELPTSEKYETFEEFHKGF